MRWGERRIHELPSTFEIRTAFLPFAEKETQQEVSMARTVTQNTSSEIPMRTPAIELCRIFHMNKRNSRSTGNSG
jgi:hypothetical protein